MKPTTYIIIVILAAGAIIAAICGYTTGRHTDLKPVEITDETTTISFNPADALTFTCNEKPSDNIRVKLDGLTFIVEESDTVATPHLTMPKAWENLLTATQSQSGIDIAVDFHAFEDQYSQISADSKVMIPMDSVSFRLEIPKASLGSILFDCKEGLVLKNITSDSLQVSHSGEIVMIDSHLLKLSSIPFARDDSYRRTHRIDFDSCTINTLAVNLKASGLRLLGTLTAGRIHAFSDAQSIPRKKIADDTSELFIDAGIKFSEITNSYDFGDNSFRLTINNPSNLTTSK